MPDGWTSVLQCKRYVPSSTIASRELRDLLGAKVHFQADVAVFVTTTKFSRPSERFAVEHGILAVHRDHLGLWNNGASLLALSRVNGRGQGDSRHRSRWKQAYGKWPAPQSRSPVTGCSCRTVATPGTAGRDRSLRRCPRADGGAASSVCGVLRQRLRPARGRAGRPVDGQRPGFVPGHRQGGRGRSRRALLSFPALWT
nr:restriction endonuclease [Streptomyces caniscabiei]